MKRQVCSKLADLPADLPPWCWHLVVKNGHFILADQVVDLPADLPPVDLPVTCNFRFLLYELFLADQVAIMPQSCIDPLNTTTQISCYVIAHIGRWSGRSTPLQFSIDPLNTATPKVADLHPRSASGSEWQFKIFTAQAHSGRSTGNLRFFLFKLIVADQLADLPPLGRPTPCQLTIHPLNTTSVPCWQNWQACCLEARQLQVHLVKHQLELLLGMRHQSIIGYCH